MSQALWYVFFNGSFKSTNVYLIIDYGYQMRGLEMRSDTSQASLIYVPSYHHIDECERGRGQGWGQMRTKGKDRGT